MLLDVRCYDCPDFDPEAMTPIPKKEYIGDGKFKCPRCGHVMDLSGDTYKLRVRYKEVTEDDESYVDIELLDPHDARLDAPYNPNHNKDLTTGEALLNDMVQEADNDLVQKHRLGVFDIEVFWIWYRCSYEYDEWDMDLVVLKETEVPNGHLIRGKWHKGFKQVGL